MELLNRLLQYATYNKTDAFKNDAKKEVLSYKELEVLSNKIAKYLLCHHTGKTPVIVYGHKSSTMIAAFIGCVKAGHPYCPVDISMPDDRLADILEITGAKLIIKTEECNLNASDNLSRHDILNLPDFDEDVVFPHISDEDVFYIIFTSGSTGKPKGVQITVGCLDSFLSWMESIARREGFVLQSVFLNQAPFSFDLSVMDTFTSLFLGGTICALDKVIQEDFEALYNWFYNNKISVWVSTPSFVNMCLINPKFNQEMLPHINTFLFCGEILTKRTVRFLYKRFPRAKVINTYGPTESTVAVSEVLITEAMIASEKPLPIGFVKPGTSIFIMNESYAYPGLGEGTKGEIVIAGDTVAKGYLNQLDLTKDKFFDLVTPKGSLKAYKTGDEGWMENGLLYYSGRMDNQLKINGYRIELEDVESNILKHSDIKECVVLPIGEVGAYKGLVAFLFLGYEIEDEFRYSKDLRNRLKEAIPAYMIPKRFVFVKSIPRTINGKIDRKALNRMVYEGSI